VPTEFLDDNEKTLETGYIFSYFSSSAPALPAPSSATLVIAFDLSVPEYFYQVRQVQDISGLQFVVGLVSLAGGVVAVGSVVANAGSYLFQRWKDNKGHSTIETPMNPL